MSYRNPEGKQRFPHVLQGPRRKAKVSPMSYRDPEGKQKFPPSLTGTQKESKDSPHVLQEPRSKAKILPISVSLQEIKQILSIQKTKQMLPQEMDR